MLSSIDLERSVFRALATGASIVCAAVIAYLSLAPADGLPNVIWWDKAQHFIAYAALGAPLSIALGRSRWLIAIALATAYGAMMELAQGTLTDGRSAELFDGIANACGACAGVAFGYILLISFRRI